MFVPKNWGNRNGRLRRKGCKALCNVNYWNNISSGG